MEKEMSLADVRKYIPYVTAKDIANLGVAPQDYAAFGFERVVRKGEKVWVHSHIIIRSEQGGNTVWEIQARWLNASKKYSGEGLAYVVAPTAATAQIAFRDYVVNNCGEKNPIVGGIFCQPRNEQKLLMTGSWANCKKLESAFTNYWFKKALGRERLQLDAETDEINTEITNFEEETKMKNADINNDNGNFEGNVSLDFFKPGCAKLEDDEPQTKTVVKTAPATIVEEVKVDEYAVTDAAFEVAVAAEIAAAANNSKASVEPSGGNIFTAITVLKPAGTANHDDTPPVNPSPNKARKMPGVIAGLNVAAAITADLTMAEAARRMGEIRTLRAQLKALGKPGVEVKVPTRPQRVRGHKLADAVVEFELFEDFYKVLVAEFEAKYGAATTTAVDNPLPADKPEAATVQEQEEISPNVPDTATADEKSLPKPEDPEDDPEDHQDPEEPSDDDNGGNEPANDNPPADPPVFDGGDNNNDGTGAASNVAAASADQEVNDAPDFCDEESVPPTPEELYGDSLKACFKRYSDIQALETVLSMLHGERVLYTDIDSGIGVEVDDESLDWVAAQLAQRIAVVEDSYTGGGFYEETDFSDALKAEPEQEPQSASALSEHYENLLLQYCKFPKYELNADAVSAEEYATEMADYARIEREQVILGGQMLAAFFGDDTDRAAAALEKAVNGYSDQDMTVKNRYQRLTYGKRCPLRKIFGIRQDKRGNFYVKGDRGKVRNDWMRATVIEGVGFVFEAAPQGTHFFR